MSDSPAPAVEHQEEKKKEEEQPVVAAPSSENKEKDVAKLTVKEITAKSVVLFFDLPKLRKISSPSVSSFSFLFFFFCFFFFPFFVLLFFYCFFAGSPIWATRTFRRICAKPICWRS